MNFLDLVQPTFHTRKFFYFAEKTQVGDWRQNKIWKNVGISNFRKGRHLADLGAVLTVKSANCSASMMMHIVI